MAPPVAAGEVHGGRSYELCVHTSFCVSGIITTIAMQWEDYHGLGGNSNKPLSRTTALPVLPTFAANVLAVGWMFQQHEGRQLFDKRMWWLVIFALIGEIANQASIVFAGSLTFTVVYSSVTIWTACLGMPILGSRPSRLQWLALATIVAGLLAAALTHTAQKGKRHTLQHYQEVGLNGTAHLAAGLAVAQGQEHLQDRSTAGASTYVFGAGAGLVGSLAYALVYVTTELIQQPADAPPPEVICAFVGLAGTAVVGTYIAVWDGPRWEGLVAEELTASYTAITSVYAVIILAAFLHNLAFYHLCRMSAVKAGVNKAVQAVSVFAASHIFFCDTDKQQCMTSGKAVAMAMTVTGVLMYSFGKPVPASASAGKASKLGGGSAEGRSATVRRLRGRREQPGSVEEGERRGLLDEDDEEAP